MCLFKMKEIDNVTNNAEELSFLYPVIIVMVGISILLCWILSVLGILKDNKDKSLRKQQREYLKQEKRIQKELKWT